MFINPGWLCALTRAQALRETEVAEAEQAATKLQQAVDSGEVIAASTDMPQETCLPGMTPQSQQREKEEIVEPTVAELLTQSNFSKVQD
jgi:hypothetical protein